MVAALVAMSCFSSALGQGTISGQVVRASNSAPITNAMIFAQNVDTFENWYEFSGTNGRFVISNVTAGSYILKADPPLFTDLTARWFNGVDAAPWEWDVPGIRTMIVVNAATTSTIFRLSQESALIGRVTNSLGQGIADVTMYVMLTNGSAFNSMTTDENGFFSFRQLAARTFALYAAPLFGSPYLYEWYNNIRVPFDFDMPPPGFTPITLTTGQVNNTFGMQLELGGQIRGRVTNTAGAAIADLNVAAFSTNGSEVADTFTDALGNYVIQGLPPGGYRVRTRAQISGLNYIDHWFNQVRVSGFGLLGTTITAAVNSVASNINFRLPPGAVLEVCLRDEDGAPITNELISVVLVSGGEYEEAFTVNDESGTASFVGMTSGVYHVRAEDYDGEARVFVPMWYDDVVVNPGSLDYYFIPAGASPVTLVEGTTRNMCLTLIKGGVIEGTVSDADGFPIESAEVFGFWAYQEDYSPYGADLFDQTDEDGLFRLTGLMNGVYHVRAQGGQYAPNAVSLWYSNSPSAYTKDLGGLPILVKAGEIVSNLNFRLPNGGAVTGSVTFGINPLPGMTVRAYSLSNLFEEAEGVADFSGFYRIEGLPPGRYYLRTTDGDDYGYADQWFPNIPLTSAIPPAAGMAVTVMPTSVSGPFNFLLTNEAVITGFVRTNGVLSIDAEVQLYNFGGELLDYTYTDETGAYVFWGLAAGRYYVRAENQPPFRGLWFTNVPISGASVTAGASNILVAAGATRGNINFNLGVGGCITGRVTTADGHVVAGVWVAAVNSVGEAIEYGRTDTGGWYRIRGLPGTNVAVYLNVNYPPPGYAPMWFGNIVMTSTSVPGGATAWRVATNTCAGPANFVLPDVLADITAASVTNQNALVNWTGAFDRLYQIQVSTNLSRWHDAPSGLGVHEQSRQRVRDANALIYRRPGVATNAAEFFRAKTID